MAATGQGMDEQARIAEIQKLSNALMSLAEIIKAVQDKIKDKKEEAEKEKQKEDGQLGASAIDMVIRTAINSAVAPILQRLSDVIGSGVGRSFANFDAANAAAKAPEDRLREITTDAAVSNRPLSEEKKNALWTTINNQEESVLNAQRSVTQKSGGAMGYMMRLGTNLVENQAEEGSFLRMLTIDSIPQMMGKEFSKVIQDKHNAKMYQNLNTQGN